MRSSPYRAKSPHSNPINVDIIMRAGDAVNTCSTLHCHDDPINFKLKEPPVAPARRFETASTTMPDRVALYTSKLCQKNAGPLQGPLRGDGLDIFEWMRG